MFHRRVNAKTITTLLIALFILSMLLIVMPIPSVEANSPTVKEYKTVVANAADRLIALQSNTDYGWDWNVTGLTEHSAANSSTNLYGVTALGLLDAYELTGNTSYFETAKNVADFIMYGNASEGDFYYGWDSYRFGHSFDYRFLVRFAEISGNTTYKDYAIDAWNWVTENRGENYGDGNQTNMYNYLYSAFGSSHGGAIWQSADYALAALTCDDTAWAENMASVIQSNLTKIDGTDDYRYIGWGKGLEMFQVVDPTTYATEIAAIISNLTDSQNDNGSWGSGENPEGIVQDTAYVIVGLNAAGELETARKGAHWLVSNQEENGGWLCSPTEYSEIDSEAIQALAATPASVTIDTKGYYTIQSAIDAANPGDTILVHAGTYDEQVVIDRALTLEGEGESTIIQPSDGTLTTVKTTPWLGIGTKQMAAIVFVNATGEVTINDLQINGSLIAEAPAGIGVDGWVAGLAYLETSGTIKGLTVIGNSELSCRTAGIWASAISSVSTVEVTQCTVQGYNRAGIYAVGDTLTADYHHNVINGPGALTKQVPNGIYFLRDAKGSATYNTITDLGFIGEQYLSTGIGVYEAGPDVIIAHNEIYNVQMAICFAKDSSGTIAEYNNIHDCHTGVKIEFGAANHIIQYNDIHDNDFAIRCGKQMGIGNVAHYNNFVNNLGLEWTNDEEESTYKGAVCNLNETYTLNATLNWWGDASGPYHETRNSDGKGDAVSDNVTFTPWYATSTTTPERQFVTVEHFDSVLAYSDTIQGGIDASCPGDTINVAAGTYDEHVVIDKSLTLQGESPTGTVITNGIKFDTSAGDIVGVSILNFTIQGNAGTYGNGVTIGHIGEGYLYDLTFDNNIFDGQGSVGMCFYINPVASDFTFTNNEVTGYTDWGTLYIGEGTLEAGPSGPSLSTVTFENNYIHDNRGSSVVYGNRDNFTDNFVVRNNKFENNGGHEWFWAAIEIRNAENVVVENNIFEGSPVGMEDIHGAGLYFTNENNGLISGKVVHNDFVNNYQGIYVYSGNISGLQVHFNNFSRNGIAIELGEENPTGTLNATLNDWGVYTFDEIEALIYHKLDNSTLGEVTYAPWIVPEGYPQPPSEQKVEPVTNITEPNVVNATDVADVVITVNVTSPTSVIVANHTANPHPEAFKPDEMLPKYVEIAVGNKSAVNWPIYIELHYTDEEVAGLNEVILGLYYFKDGSWHRCRNTGVNVNTNIIWAYVYEDEYVGSPYTGSDRLSYNLTLYPQWNLMSLPLIPENASITHVLQPVSDDVDVVWSYNPESKSWSVYNPAPEAPRNLTTIRDGLGYWVKTKTTETVTFSLYGYENIPGPNIPPTYKVYTGWNLMGFKALQEMNSTYYLRGVDYIRRLTYIPTYGWVRDPLTMMPGYGYWIYVSEEGVIVP